MNIEILGIDPANKGAGLMVEAIKCRIRERFPNARFAIPMDAKTDSRLAFGLWGSFSRGMGKKRRLTRWSGELLPDSVLRQFGVLPDRQIDVILDASGFAYGDFWGPQKLHNRVAAHIERWRKGRKTVIFLPQAWGSFESPQFSPYLELIFANADLVFARDCESLANLTGAVGKKENLRLAPDFTNLLHPDLPSRLKSLTGQVLIVPNTKVVEAQGDGIRSRYIGFLATAARTASEHGLKASFLIHEGRNDFALAQEINSELDMQLPIIDEADPLATKALIGNSFALISSRFHGLVSGLSSGVTSLACGWSHKYQELLRDYGCPEYAVNLGESFDTESILKAFFENCGNEDFRARLRAAADVQREKSAGMWQEVLLLLEGQDKK